MSFPETSSINYNTRQNNNIAWRNMNVVDLMLNKQVDVSFIARSLAKTSNQIMLQIGESEQQRFRREGGKIHINLFEFTGKDEWAEIHQLPHIIRDLQAPNSTDNAAKVKLRFSAGPMPITDRVSGLYHIDVLQLDTDSGTNQRVGGVAYEIVTRTMLTDSDNDQKPDIQDDDDDNDQVPDTQDNYPLDPQRH